MSQGNYIKGNGNIFPNRYKDAPNKPDYTGELVITKEILKQLVTQVKEGKEAGLRLAVWDRESRAGNPFKYVSFEPVVPKPREPYNGGNGYQKATAKPKAAPAPAKEEEFQDDEVLPF